MWLAAPWSAPPPNAPRLLHRAQAKKAKAGEGINSRIQLVVKSGKFTLGYKTVLKQLRGGKCACAARPPRRQPATALLELGLPK